MSGAHNGAPVRPLHPASPAEVEYVARGRALHEAKFPGAGHFDEPTWDVLALRASAHRRTNRTVHFTRAGSQEEPLPPRFAEVLKALCVLNLQSQGQLRFRVEAARALWEAVLERRGGDPERFTWAGLTVEDARAAEQWMLRTWAASTVYKHCGVLQRMLNLLSAAAIIRPMSVPFVTPRPEHAARHTLAGQARSMARLPSEEAIGGVADIYALHARTQNDQLLACILAIAISTGLRIGEVLTLPRNCLVTEGSGAERKWGLRYNKQKSRGRFRVLSTFWLTPAQARLARQAVHRARRLTRAAHLQARVLDASPHTVPLPGYTPDSELGRATVASLLGYRAVNSINVVPRDVLPRVTRSNPAGGRQTVFVARDVSAFLQTLRPRPAWVVDRGDGSKQMLSESLFVAFRNQMHGIDPDAPGRARGTNPLVVESISEAVVNAFLGGHNETTEEGEPGAVLRDGRWMCMRTPSAFARFDIREKGGSIVRVTSHGFRHWLTTRAAAAGVDDATLRRWQNREHGGDLDAYKHLTPQQRIVLLKEGLVSGQIRGRLAEMYFALTDDVRDVFLENHLQAVHVTPYGLCVHDFKVSPCPKALNCLKDCNDFVHDTANADQRLQLVQLGNRTALALDQARRQRDRGEDDLSESWVADLEETQRGVAKVLSATPAADTTFVRPFVGAESRFQPLED